jgi:carbon-monoxide dehydrogenase large subunit
VAVTQLVGAKIHRREDPRLITGHGHYIDDFTRTATAHAAFVRSPLAHARIKSIDVTDAAKAPGVVGVYTARDFKNRLAGTHPAAPAFVAEKKYVPERFPIAEKEVTYQGEIVAAVLAETRAQAADAANLIQVEYQELPAVMDLEKALEKGSPKAHEDGPDNVCWDFTYTPLDLTEAAFKEADVVVKERILQNRLAPVPMEPRGVLADFEAYDKKLTIWMSSQNPHFIRLFVSGAMGLKESQVRVISPDVGGGFGSKISPYPEDYLVPTL